MKTWIITGIVLALAAVMNATGQTGVTGRTVNPYHQAALDFAKLSPVQQIDAYREMMRKEISTPTQPHRGFGGGMITHEYQMRQFEKGLFNVLAAPDVRGHRIAAPSVVEYLRGVQQAETNREARAVMAQVLRMFDDHVASQKKDGEPQGGGYSPPAARSAQPTP